MDGVQLYLELLKKILLNEIYFEHEHSLHFQGDEPARREARRCGRDVPGFALTMVGRQRLDNLHTCIEQVLADRIPGDLMEAGTWRGGASIFMRAALRAHGVTDRRVWVADSFAGLPPPNVEKFPADAGDVLYTQPELAVSLAQVQANFAKFDLLDDQVQFLKGFFSDTLPTAPVGPLAVLRLDGDMYESTYVSLANLYDRVVPGGFVIVDDYNCYASCRQAVADFGGQQGLSFDIREVDWTGAYWRKP